MPSYRSKTSTHGRNMAWTALQNGHPYRNTLCGSMSLAALSLTASLALLPIPALAQSVMVTGDVTPAGATSPNWNVASDLAVGSTGTGTIDVLGGGTVSNDFGYIGYQAGSTGTVTVSDAGSQWANLSALTVGNSGDGTLLIAGGGSVTSFDSGPGPGTPAGVIGGNAGSNGTVTVTGPGSGWTATGAAGAFYVGLSGNGTLAIQNGGVITNGDGYIGAFASGTGEVTVSGSGSTWTNAGFLAVGAAGSGSLTIADGGSVSNGYNFIGANVGGTGTVTVSDANSTWTNGSFLIVGDDGSGGLVIANGGTVRSLEGFIGYGATGVGTTTVSGASSTWTSSADLTIGVFGSGALNIENAGTVSSSLGTIGVYTGATGTVTVSGAGSIWTNSDSLYVGELGTGTLNITNGGMVSAPRVYLADGAGSTGVLALGGSLDGNGNPQAALAPGAFNTPQVRMGSGTAQIVFNHTDASSNYIFSPTITGTGMVDVYSGTTVMGSASNYAGPTTVHGGTLSAGAANVLSPNSDYVVQTGATLALNGFDQALSSLNNAGTVETQGAPGTVLNVMGVYTSNGGNLLLDSVLGDNDTLTDKLVADSVVLGSGATKLMVKNLNGLGGLTSGNGIEVVQVNGESAAKAFQLSNRVAAGAYEYSLAQNNGNWYLSSTFSEVPVPPQPSPRPNYRVEVPLGMATSAMANTYGLSMLGTYYDRVGEEYAVSMGTGNAKLGWTRAIGESGKVGKTGYDNFLKQGPSYSYDSTAIQVGQDVWRDQHANGSSDVIGAYLGAGTTSGTVDAVAGSKAGTVSMNGYSLGSYWTRQTQNGWYFDGVLQATAYDSVKTRSVRGERTDSRGYGTLGSLETGYPIDVGQYWTLEPQAQVIYQHVSLNTTRDSYGRIDYGNTDATYMRMGARLSKQLSTRDAKPVTVWARANVWQHLGADANTTFTDTQSNNPTSLQTSLGGSWAQAGVGASGQVSKKVSMFASADYNQALGSQIGHSMSGRVGVRIAW